MNDIDITLYPNIIQYPDKRLRVRAFPLDVVKDRVKIDSIASDMRLVLDKAAGIAAPQFGEQSCMIGVWYGLEKLILVNPEIIKVSEQTFVSDEGCLSIDEGKAVYSVVRHKIVKVKALDLQGNSVTYKGRGVLGQAFQHEIDHLNGILLVDKK